jgi:beta-lactamase class A
MNLARESGDESRELQMMIQARLSSLIAESGIPSVGLALFDLATDDQFSFNGDRVFASASMMKTPVLAEVYRQAAEGRFSLDDKVLINNEFKSIADGSTYRLSPDDDSELGLYKRLGQTSTIRELSELMIAVSSNLATNILIDLVPPQAINEFMTALGAQGIHLLRGVMDLKAFDLGLNNTVTAQSLLILFKCLAQGRVVSKAASEEMIAFHARQQHNEAMPRYLPAGTIVAHKTGWNTGIYHDGGIVKTSGRSFCLVALTQGAQSKEHAEEFVARVTRTTYDALLAS